MEGDHGEGGKWTMLFLPLEIFASIYLNPIFIFGSDYDPGVFLLFVASKIIVRDE